ncbi:MAG: apolipoprotein N-acyltransferase [Bdellovibrionales bacterium]|nr:apolipoprotein N-acyltransferase [Bdellovibrionales bacterium]
MRSWLKSYSLPILSGILIGTSYIPFPPWSLFFCLIPLLIFWSRETSWKKILIGGWLTQFILNAIGFHWIAYTTVTFGRLPWAVGLLVLLLFCSLAHLYYPIAGFIWHYLTKKFNLSRPTSLLVFPLIFVFCERIYPYLFYWHFGYPWLWARLPGYHLASWIGFVGLDLITIYINILLFAYWQGREPNSWRKSPAFIGAFVLFIGTNLLGFIQSQFPTQTDQKLKVVAVQGNIGNLEKAYAEHGNRYVESIVNTYIDLTEKALLENPGTDLVIWPETAFPEMIYPNRLGRERQRLAQLTEKYDFHLLTGAYQRKSITYKAFNGIVLMKGDKNLGSYQKTHLLAYGEYLPFGETFPQLKKMLPMVSDFGRGDGPVVIDYEKAKIGAQICYEGLFDEFSTEQQRNGAQIYVNITNDSWFGWPFEPYQHMFMTLARAVENQRPMVRVTNTGVTTVALPTGKTLEMSPHAVPWYGVYEVPFAATPPSTFYVRLAMNWTWILFFLVGLAISGDRLARTEKH